MAKFKANPPQVDLSKIPTTVEKGCAHSFAGKVCIVPENTMSPAATIVLRGTEGQVQLGEVFVSGENEKFNVLDQSGRRAIQLDGRSAALMIGIKGNEGGIVLYDGAGQQVFVVNGEHGSLYIGGQDNEGDLFVKDGYNLIVFHVDGKGANLKLGRAGNPGDIAVLDTAGQPAFSVNAEHGSVYVGTKGNEGDLFVRDKDERLVFHIDGSSADMRVGTEGNAGDITVLNKEGTPTIHLDGQAGDIILSNADFAEDFDIQEAICDTVEAGTVMSLNESGKLIESTQAYDKKVAGVLSGAGPLRPGIVMDKQPGARHRLPVALVGKVYCKVDASNGPIAVGDLLTTSDTPGHAMKATDPSLAFGAVIGKALQAHRQGQGRIPILVNLQ